ncbi:MAG TPA: hypothetical protein VMQ44_01445 [Candidatus Saccharimonadales bacterium]|nr:hypothetical protein [Candidatus Saccharimonadales bacterium]
MAKTETTSRTRNTPIAPVVLNPLISPGAYRSMDAALHSIFPGPAEENKLQRARRILGEVATDVPDEELEIFLTNFQCLIDSWFDFYEKQVFNGLTLKQVLREGR